MIGMDTLLCAQLASQAVEYSRGKAAGLDRGPAKKQATAFRVNMDFYVTLEQQRRRIRGQREENDEMVLRTTSVSRLNN